MWQLVKGFYAIIAVLVGLFICIKSLDYLHPNFTQGFLIGKEPFFYTYYAVVLYIHMFAAPLALFTGLIQFLFTKSKWHKRLGQIYVMSILGFAAPSGLLMAFHALGGNWAILNFVLLAILWVFFTRKAYQTIRRKNIKAHQRFMTRSFILTNSAVFIRLFSFINHQYLDYPPLTAYVIISWLSWLPFLMIYEGYLLVKQ
ncbi:MAG: DUF2306 domain-containing protein [Flammeovirgaceae bacterium]